VVVVMVMKVVVVQSKAEFDKEKKKGGMRIEQPL